MQQETINFSIWQARFGTDEACLEAIAAHRWRNGFRCPACDYDQAWVLGRRCIRQCRKCGHQTSPTAGTLFENTRLPMTKWFTTIYLMTVDQNGPSAEQLRKMIGVCWRSAQRMLDKLRVAMGDRDFDYLLTGRVEMDDRMVGNKTH